MSYTDPEPPDGQTRDEHIATCIGCQHIARLSTSGRPRLTCYEHSARSQYASRNLVNLFKQYLGPCDVHGVEWVGHPRDLPGMVDAIAERVPARSIDLGRPAIVRWVAAAEDGDGYVIWCQCQNRPTDHVHDDVEQVASAPCRLCGETTPAVFAASREEAGRG